MTLGKKRLDPLRASVTQRGGVPIVASIEGRDENTTMTVSKSLKPYLLWLRGV